MAVTAVQGIVQGKLQAGGTLGEDYRYIRRPADDELREALLAGELCYVLAPRQIGKSSLRVRTEAALVERGVQVATLSLDAVGTAGTATEWFGSLIKLLHEQLFPGLGRRLKSFWEESQGLTPAHRFAHYLREHVLGGTGDDRIVVFIDEIDTLLSGDMPRDDFFAIVRALYNDRATDPACGRLTFCLLGVAAPGDLIGDPVRTNFNIGRRVVLRDFTEQEVQGFKEDLTDLGGDPEALLARIFEWTHGHPFMTQRLCVGLHEQRRREAPVDVDGAVRQLFLRSGRSDDPNLSYAEERLARHTDPGPLLSLYRRLLEVEGEPVGADRSDWMQLELQLCGLAAEREEREGLCLRVRNRIFATVFGPEWVQEKMGGRLLAVALARWQEAGRRGEAALRGDELSAAQVWAKAHPREVTAEESEFLLACVEETRRETEERRLAAEVGMERERRERVEAASYAQRRLVIVLTAAVVGLLMLAGGLAWQYEEARGSARRADEATKHEREARERAENLARTEQNLRAAALVTQPGHLMEALVAGMKGAYLDLERRHFEARNWEGLLAAADLCVRSRSLEGHSAGVNSAAFSPDGKIVVTGSGDRTARLWTANTGRLILTLEGHSAAFSPDGKTVITGSWNPTAQLWEASSGRLLRTLEGHSAGVNSAAFSPDGKTVITGSGDRTARVWEVSSGKLLRILEGHSDAVNSATFSPDGKTVVTGSQDGRVGLWEASRGKLLRILGHLDAVNSAAFSPNSKTVVTGSGDGAGRLWEPNSGRLILTLVGHSYAVVSASFSLDGKIVVTGSRDGTARLWEVSSGKLLRILEGHLDGANSAAFSPDGKTVVTGSDDRTARLWEVSSGNILCTLEGYSAGVNSASFSPDGKTVVTGNKDGMARLWEANSCKLLRTLEAHSGEVHSASFSPDGRTVVTGNKDGMARLWEASSGKLLRTLVAHTAGINSTVFSPDSKTVMTGSLDKTARLWDASSGRLLHMLAAHSAGILTASFSPDGKTVVTGSKDGTAWLWEVNSGKLMRTLAAHSSWVNSAAFSPDSKTVITGGWDGKVRLWEASSGKLLRTLGQSAAVESAVFSPDGKTVVTGSWDGTARLWETASGRLLLKLGRHSAAVRSVAFSPDGKTVLTASADGTAILHPAHHEDYYRFACQVLSTWRKLPNVSDKDLAEVKATCPREP